MNPGEVAKISSWDPSSTAELVEAVRAAKRVIAVGAQTKPRLSSVGSDVARISTAKLRGISEYEPSEFTFTAWAGTPVKEIATVLAERGQYLPFDPPLAETGATLAGTVAAGLSGPGRFRFGGLRDFILGVTLVDGTGRSLRLGGKVVKNAAGFDVPKFLVGSIGRFGIIAGLTLKVFPRARQTRTLSLEAEDSDALTAILTEAARTRWELDALELVPGEGRVMARLAGPESALDALAAEVLTRWPGRVLEQSAAHALWSALGEFRWAHPAGTLVKVVLAPAQVKQFVVWAEARSNVRSQVGSGGNVGYLSFPAGTASEKLPWPALTLRGVGPLWPGEKRAFAVMRAVKAALDPNGRFPDLDE